MRDLEKCKARKARYRAKHREQIKVYFSGYLEEHREENKARLRKRRDANPETDRQRCREYHEERIKDPAFRESERIRVLSRYRGLREGAIARLGGKCSRCGYDDSRALQVDHVDNNGGTHRKERGTSRSSFFLSIIKGICKYRVQLLCANCNELKRWEPGGDHYNEAAADSSLVRGSHQPLATA